MSRIVTESERDEIEHAFRLFDTNGSGTISVDDIREALADAGSQTQRMFETVLSSTRKSLTLDEFVDILTKRNGDPHDLNHVFSLFDTDEKGYITVADLKQIAHNLGELMSMGELEEMVNIADSNGDGRVTKEDFNKIMRQKLWG